MTESVKIIIFPGGISNDDAEAIRRIFRDFLALAEDVRTVLVAELVRAFDGA